MGGNEIESLQRLSNTAGVYKSQLESGITLAAISRITSGSINKDVSTALGIICGKAIEELKPGSKLTDEFYYLYQSEGNSEGFF